jgi:hypothetical protein
VEAEAGVGRVEQGLAREAVAVAVQPARAQAERDVAGADAARSEHLGAVDDADGEGGEVVVAVGVEARQLGGLAAEQRAAGLATAVDDAADQRLDEVGGEHAAGDVVEQEQRLRAGDQQVVDAHRHEVDADRVVAVHGDRDQQLGADAIGAGHEHRLRDAGRAGPSSPRSRRCRRSAPAGACCRPAP